MRDFQRQKVYDWEDKYIQPVLHQHLDLMDCQKLSNRIADWYDIPHCKIRVGNNRIHNVYRKGCIELAYWGLIEYIIVHETVHHVCEIMYEPRHGHSQTFVNVYIKAVKRLTGLKTSILKSSAKNCGVKFY